MADLPDSFLRIFEISEGVAFPSILWVIGGMLVLILIFRDGFVCLRNVAILAIILLVQSLSIPT